MEHHETKVKEIKLQAYPGTLKIVVSDSLAGVKQVFSDFDGNTVFAHSIKTESEEELVFGIILNPYHKNIKGRYVAHEAFHVSNFVMETIGEPASYEAQEPQAYLLAYIYAETLEFLDELGLNIKY